MLYVIFSKWVVPNSQISFFDVANDGRKHVYRFVFAFVWHCGVFGHSLDNRRAHKVVDYRHCVGIFAVDVVTIHWAIHRLRREQTSFVARVYERNTAPVQMVFANVFVLFLGYRVFLLELLNPLFLGLELRVKGTKQFPLGESARRH